MEECKLCHEGFKGKKVSSADPKMCSTCYKDLVKYKRLIVKDRAMLPPGNIKHIDRLELMFKHNSSIGGYVPRCYTEGILSRQCATCTKFFKATENTQYCNACRKRERAFRSLYANRPSSPTLDYHMDYYLELHRLGRKVPKLWHDIKAGIK